MPGGAHGRGRGQALPPSRGGVKHPRLLLDRPSAARPFVVEQEEAVAVLLDRRALGVQVVECGRDAGG